MTLSCFSFGDYRLAGRSPNRTAFSTAGAAFGSDMQSGCPAVSLRGRAVTAFS
jgi:hypothetical protein